jgi:hypothetical protein
VLVAAPDLDLPPDFAGDGMMAQMSDYSISRKLNALLESTNDDEKDGIRRLTPEIGIGRPLNYVNY